MKPPNLPDDVVVENFEFNNIPKEPGIYRIYDKYNRLLYIGKTSNLRTRIISHFKGTTNTRKYSHLFKKVICSYVPNYLEKELIEKMKPLLNFEHSLPEQGLVRYEWEEEGWKYICESLNVSLMQYEKYRKEKSKNFIPFSIIRNKVDDWRFQKMKDYLLPNVDRLVKYIDENNIIFESNLRILKKNFNPEFSKAFKRYCLKEKEIIIEKIKKHEIKVEAMFKIKELFSQEDIFKEIWEEDFNTALEFQVGEINNLLLEHQRFTELESRYNKLS